ncbi:response regulator [Nitrospirales bacterium NOB]|nr:MAG: putative response regulator [Nitrospira sp. OLB3]MBV6471695.1 hypothetical protein [Nitrospirota bacterium]MCE7966918.1 response regulator [Nitrospira sp. NTP2]MDL1889720.1 response regulator [Nitrospirales bacterium NOB]MEB2340257.1 response regulator [Nitrospirales bacterium]QOJ34424.1 MAG: response regulator [Nitrospira sp.]
MAPTPEKPTTILLVDDDPTTLLLCAKPLQQAGYHVLQAPGSAEGLKLYAQHPSPIHLVLADIFLPPPGFQLSRDKNPYPRVNGQEMVERLLDGKREVRIVLMSSTPALTLIDRGLMRSGFSFLKKPFSSEALLTAVREVLAGPPTAVAAPKKAPSGGGEVEWVG